LLKYIIRKYIKMLPVDGEFTDDLIFFFITYSNFQNCLKDIIFIIRRKKNSLNPFPAL
jgi:hypothetical protein